MFYGCGGGLGSNRSNQRLIIDAAVASGVKRTVLKGLWSSSQPKVENMKVAILLIFVVLTVSSAQKDTNFGEQKQLQSINNGRLFQPIFNLFEMLYGLVSIIEIG